MGESAGTAETPKSRLIDQLKINGGGILGAAVAVPYVMNLWVPASVAALWGVVYLAQSCIFLGLLSLAPSPVKRLWWALASSVLFGSLNISVMIWGQANPSAAWIAAMVSFGYVSFEAATMPYLKIKQWYLGILLVAVCMAVTAAVEVHPLVGVALVPIMASMVSVAGHNKKLQAALDTQLQEAETTILTDSLTGLLNRRGLEAKLAASAHQETTVAIFDADRFKAINDTQGHGVGDQALQMIAERLRNTLSPNWEVARLGGDEFVAITAGSVDLDPSVSEPFQMPLTDRPGEVHFSISCGVATGDASETGDRLLSEAGHALRHAKSRAERILRSEGELRERFNRSLAMSNFDDAEERIVPVVQPIVDDEGVKGCELLARWRSTDGTLLAPAQFMDMLVENGLMSRLDDIMLEHAVKLAAQLQNANQDVFVSVNIAASHLLDRGLATLVAELLERHQVRPKQLMIEITESERLGSRQGWEEAVNGLHQLGVLLAIDDFGAGYSSVARLKDLPITHLKIDRSLVIDTNGPLSSIVEGVTRFCHASNVGVIAEGIETLDQHAAMRSAEVNLFQGYLFGRPMRVEDFFRDLAERSSQPGADASVAPSAAIESTIAS